MTSTDRNWTRLVDEHVTTVTEYGRVQKRASDLIAEQARVIDVLSREVMRLRVAAVIRETALIWTREDLAEVAAASPGLPKRRLLARQIGVLETRVRNLIRAQTVATVASPTASPPKHDLAQPRSHVASTVDAGPRIVPRDVTGRVVWWFGRDHRVQADTAARAMAHTAWRVIQADDGDSDAAAFDRGLADADLVICQTGCVSHGDWWRVRDYCTRTGKRCVLVEHPDVLQRLIGARPVALADADTEADARSDASGTSK